MRNYFCTIIWIILLFALIPAKAEGANVTGWREFKTEFVKLYLFEGTNPFKLDRDIDTHHIRLYSRGRFSIPSENGLDSLKKKLDLIYLKVQDILDMHLTENDIAINIVRTKAELAQEHEKIFGENKALPAFFVPKQNSVFICEKSMSEVILAHELAKAVIYNYFEVAPPEKVMDILISYVDKELKK